MNDPTLYSKDYSNCCHNRQITVPRKRKLSDSDDKEFLIEEELKNRKSSKGAANKNSYDKSDDLWKTEGEEEEVVCAPDLSLLMDDDDGPELPPQSVMPNNIRLNSIRFVAPAPVNQTMPKPLVLQRPSIRLRPPVYVRSPIVINPTVAGSPVGLQPSFLNEALSAARNQNGGIIPFLPTLAPLHSRNLSAPSSSVDNTAPKLMPGLKHEWFESSARATAKVHTKLSYEISLLSKDQSKASTIEELAKIHNKLQEVLSTSINSLIQVRRNLRSEFLAGLNKLKFSRNNNVQTAIKNVGSHLIKKQPLLSASSVTETIDLVDNSQSEEAVPKPRSYLKVRTVDELLNIPSECITIPDDYEKDSDTASCPVVKETESRKAVKVVDDVSSPAVTCDTLENSDSNKENREKFNTKTGISDKNKAMPQEENEPITAEIKRALFESKMEQLISDNLQYNCKGISLKDLKHMLSARVYVNSEPKKKPCVNKPCVMEDFEELLNGSIVAKPQ